MIHSQRIPGRPAPPPRRSSFLASSCTVAAAVEVVAGGVRLEEGPLAVRVDLLTGVRPGRRAGCTQARELSAPSCDGCGGGGCARRAAHPRLAHPRRRCSISPAGQAGGFGDEKKDKGRPSLASRETQIEERLGSCLGRAPRQLPSCATWCNKVLKRVTDFRPSQYFSGFFILIVFRG